jgi:vancomycin permeability regulator SanA
LSSSRLDASRRRPSPHFEESLDEQNRNSRGSEFVTGAAPTAKTWLHHVIRVVGTLAAIAVFIPLSVVHFTTSSYLHSVDEVPQARTALVLGAGITASGQPTDVLASRVETAVKLFEQNNVDTLIMSGDNSRPNYDEVSAMKELAVSLGVPAERVLLDYAGFRTHDSCVRAKKVFQQSSITVVTQSFHLRRAVFSCRAAGLSTAGVAAPDRRGASRQRNSAIREVPAKIIAVGDAYVWHREPRFLGPLVNIDKPTDEVLSQPLRP